MILLTLVCWSTFEGTAQNSGFLIRTNTDPPKHIDSVTIPRTQIKNVYIGLKSAEAYKRYYYECIEGANQLNKIISDQDHELKASMEKIKSLNDQNEKLNSDILQAEKKLQSIQSRKIPFWKHPILYASLGLIGGIYLMK